MNWAALTDAASVAASWARIREADGVAIARWFPRCSFATPEALKAIEKAKAAADCAWAESATYLVAWMVAL